MAKSLLLVLLLVCLTTADEYHGSAVRNRQRRSHVNAPTSSSEEQNHISTQQGNDNPVDIASVDAGPPYVPEDEPCAEEEDINLRDILDHSRTKKKTCSLEGIWYNDVGSELILNVSSQGILNGEYRTAVEKGWGSAGEGFSKVVGHANANDINPVFGMTVVWNDGASVTTWNGQCLICDGIETLETTWVLTSKADHCRHLWMANRIGQNTFTRREQKPGPRKALDTHTPRDWWNVPL